LQFFTINPKGWRNRILPLNKTREEFEVAAPKSSQLLLLMGTPTTKIQIEPINLAAPTLTCPLAGPDQTSLM
jgi:hypothetical protein